MTIKIAKPTIAKINIFSFRFSLYSVQIFIRSSILNSPLFLTSSETQSSLSIVRKHGDWYNDTCFITFTPLTSKKGEIELDCEIYSSQKH